MARTGFVRLVKSRLHYYHEAEDQYRDDDANDYEQNPHQDCELDEGRAPLQEVRLRCAFFDSFLTVCTKEERATMSATETTPARVPRKAR